MHQQRVGQPRGAGHEGVQAGWRAVQLAGPQRRGAQPLDQGGSALRQGQAGGVVALRGGKGRGSGPESGRTASGGTGGAGGELFRAREGACARTGP